MNTRSRKVGRYYQGYYTPQHLEKYVGDIKNIYYRSSWELKLMMFLDKNTNVEKWSSEPFSIPYLDKYDKKPHKYWIDFWMIVNGLKVLVEVKPHAQTQLPKPVSDKASFKKIKSYNAACITYIKNISKWEAAKLFCDSNDIQFKIFTEIDFKKINIKA